MTEKSRRLFHYLYCDGETYFVVSIETAGKLSKPKVHEPYYDFMARQQQLCDLAPLPSEQRAAWYQDNLLEWYAGDELTEWYGELEETWYGEKDYYSYPLPDLYVEILIELNLLLFDPYTRIMVEVQEEEERE